MVESNRVDADIDQLILSFVEPRWSKVARIVGLAHAELENRGLGIDSAMVGDRVEILVKTGQIESRGDVKRWRYSEIRRRPVGSMAITAEVR